MWSGLWLQTKTKAIKHIISYLNKAENTNISLEKNRVVLPWQVEILKLLMKVNENWNKYKITKLKII